MDIEELNKYLDIDLLKEILTQFQKKELPEFYKKAFDVLIEEDFGVENMGICWSY